MGKSNRVSCGKLIMLRSRIVQACEQMKGAYGRVIYNRRYQNEDIEAFVGEKKSVGRKHVDRDPAAHDMITITRASRGARVTKACEYESENFADAEDRRL